MKTLSVAEAKNTLPAAIHDAERGDGIEITRCGQPVAVLISHDRYRALTVGRTGFRDALKAFLEVPPGSDEAPVDAGEVDSWRDRRPPPYRDIY